MNLSTRGNRCFCYYYFYYYLLFLKVSGTQGIKLPKLILLKQTGNKQAISAHQISHLCPREQIEWKKKMNTFNTENSSGF